MLRKNMIKNAIVAVACSFTLFAAVPEATAGTGGSQATIRSAIRSTNADAIISALEQAENIPCNSNCMSMVMDLLENDDYRIRQVAAWWFARRPAQMRELTGQATAWLLGSSTEARNGADILGTFGYGKNIPLLETAAANGALDSGARSAVIRALGNIGNMAANNTVASAMTDGDASVRLSAVQAWTGMLKQTSAEPVVALANDSDLKVRRAALATLGQFRVASARADLENLVVSDDDAAVRRNAAWALGRIGDSSSRDALLAASADASSLVRMTAKAALSKLR
ncbi:MAG: HEAT repeat domain-containing protein [Kofleriaceae bacterium]|nr:HEAT repeat domain-containing protein [Kofleriaceae bacterium]